jgi:hypothetical protein
VIHKNSVAKPPATTDFVERRISNHVNHTSDRCSDERSRCGHSFNQRNRRPLVVRRLDERVAARKNGGDVTLPAQPFEALCAQSSNCPLDHLSVWSVSGHDETKSRRSLEKFLRNRYQQRDVLNWNQTTHPPNCEFVTASIRQVDPEEIVEINPHGDYTDFPPRGWGQNSADFRSLLVRNDTDAVTHSGEEVFNTA